MLYIICPTCGFLLGTKQIPYEKSLIELYKKYNIDQDMISLGMLENNEKFKLDITKIVNKLCKRSCCKMRLLTYVNLTDIIIQ